MANLKEQEKWEDGVYQIEENDPVLGGENGITNKPIKQLANRTLWLKKTLELFGKKSAPKDLVADSTSTADESGHSHKLPVGSTTQKGIWQATSDTGIDSDGLVLTAKAGKKLAQMIAVVQLALNNYITSSKKSSAVNSNSADTVATSAAVKTAYDNAESRVSKSGDTMSGPLTVPGVYTGSVESSGYVNISSNNGVVFYKSGNPAYTAILSENGLDIKKTVMSHEGLKADHIGYGGYGSQYDYSAPFEVIEAGGNNTSTFYPFIKGKVMSRGNAGAAFSLGYTTKQNGYNEYGNFGRGVINLVEDNGRYKNWEFEHTGVFRSAGDVITGSGNSLDWYTHVLNSLIAGITSSSYSSHYQGADVFKIKQNRLMIIRMQIGVVNSSGDYYLPESFDGPASAMAIDSGGAVNPVGAFFKGGNSVYISVTKPTNVTVITIGVKN